MSVLEKPLHCTDSWRVSIKNPLLLALMIIFDPTYTTGSPLTHTKTRHTNSSPPPTPGQGYISMTIKQRRTGESAALRKKK